MTIESKLLYTFRSTAVEYKVENKIQKEVTG